MADIYPFDPSMTKATNRIVREQHVITSTNFRDYHYVIPNFAPFFAESLTMRLRTPSNQQRDLVEGRDYYLSHQFLDASATTNRNVVGSISFLDTDLEGILEINYHTVGGSWTLTPSKITEILASNLRNPRITSWEFIANPPTRFPVVDHPHDIVDFKTMKDVKDSIDGIRDAVLGNASGGLNSHVNNNSNPHGVTKSQVGLGAVENYRLANKVEAEDGVLNTRYMTPLRVAEAIAVQAGQMVDSHSLRTDNPHGVTKAQIGLGSVQNYDIATKAEAEAGTTNGKYVTPLRVAEAVSSMVGNSHAQHVANTNNPHNVTKSQIGLFNVENYLIATADEARVGERNDRYMTPQRTSQYVQQYVFSAVGDHATNYSNPHNTTKLHVGLGSVQNYGIATLEEARAGNANDRYMTPYLTREAISAVSSAVGDHAFDTTNPHSVTKAQVGLSNVVNYGLATKLDAEAGTNNSTYVTPLRVAEAISSMIGQAATTHIADKSNPHGVTKAQVGLGSVSNYGTATTAEAEAGTVDNKFVTPLGVKAAIVASNREASNHLVDTSNPHRVTAAQVGTYTSGEIDTFLGEYLRLGARAADSSEFEGMSAEEYLSYAVESQLFSDFKNSIEEDVALNFMPLLSVENTSKDDWHEIHSMTNSATAGGGAEASDGFAMLVIGGTKTNAGKTTTVFLRTLSRVTSGAGITVTTLDNNTIDPTIQFGYVRSNGILKSYVRIPSNSGLMRVCELGNKTAISGAVLSASPSGFTAVTPTNLFALNTALTNRVGVIENSTGTLVQTTNAHGTEIAELYQRLTNAENSIANINQLLQSITVL